MVLEETEEVEVGGRESSHCLAGTFVNFVLRAMEKPLKKFYQGNAAI